MENNKIILNTSESLKEEVDFFLRYNNLSREKINLFHDFVVSLDDIIETTYLGPDVLNDDNDIKGHYGWCWKKVVDGFNKERIFFKDNGAHFEYFWNFYYQAYYLKKINNEDTKIDGYYFKIFDLTHQKTEFEFEILLYIYKIFEQNLKK